MMWVWCMGIFMGKQFERRVSTSVLVLFGVLRGGSDPPAGLQNRAFM
jgi:hypothetical protein